MQTKEERQLADLSWCIARATWRPLNESLTIMSPSCTEAAPAQVDIWGIEGIRALRDLCDFLVKKTEAFEAEREKK